MRIDKRTFLYSASIMAISNIGLQALGFVYRIALSRLAGAEGLGIYRLVFSVYTIINAASLSGVTMACSRLAASKNAQGRSEQLRPLTRLAVGIFVTLFAVCVAVVAPFHTWIAESLLGDARTAQALPVMLACLFLTGFENIMKALFVGIGRVKFAALSETGEQIIRFVVVVALLRAYGGAQYGRIAALIMLGMTISELFSVLFLGTLYHKHIAKLGHGRVVKADAGLCRHVLDIAVPLTVAALFINCISSAGAVILPARLVLAGMTRGQAVRALGVISGMALPLVLLPMALVSAVGTVLVPAITAAQARADGKRVRALTDKALTVTGLLALPITAIIVPLSPSLARVFFGQSIPLAYMAMLGIAVLLADYQMMTASLLHGIGAQRRAVVASVCGEILQLGLIWVLAAQQSLQIYGYIIAMIISPIPVIIANLIGLRRKAGYHLRVLHTFGLPLLCSATVWLWVRVFYTACLGWVGMQWLAAVLSMMAGLLLYVVLLQLLGVRVKEYIAKRMEPSPMPQVLGLF